MALHCTALYYKQHRTCPTAMRVNPNPSEMAKKMSQGKNTHMWSHSHCWGSRVRAAKQERRVTTPSWMHIMEMEST